MKQTTDGRLAYGFFPEAIDNIPLFVRNQVIIGERYQCLKQDEAPEGVRLTYLLVKSLGLLSIEEFQKVAPHLFSYQPSTIRERPLVEKLQGTFEEYDLLKEGDMTLFGLDIDT